MKTKFIILISLVLICTMGILGQTDNSVDDKVSSQSQEIELEKTIREAVKNSHYIYVAKVKSRVLVRSGLTFTGRHGETVIDHIFSNRMLIEKNLKGTNKKLINLKDDDFKKGANYLIFANTNNSFTKAINLDVSTKELEIVERILSEK